MAKVESIQPHLEPLRRSVVVSRTPQEAFEIFTRIGTWWPTRQFSLHLDQVKECGIEPRVGGEIYEIANDGERGIWGTVLVWEPPQRLVMSWHPGSDPATPTEVEVRFTAVPEGTRVDLEHRNWIKLGERGAAARTGYENGWPTVFDQCYREACR